MRNGSKGTDRLRLIAERHAEMTTMNRTAATPSRTMSHRRLVWRGIYASSRAGVRMYMAALCIAVLCMSRTGDHGERRRLVRGMQVTKGEGAPSCRTAERAAGARRPSVCEVL